MTEPLTNSQMRTRIAHARKDFIAGKGIESFGALCDVLDEIVVRFTLAEIQERVNDRGGAGKP